MSGPANACHPSFREQHDRARGARSCSGSTTSSGLCSSQRPDGHPCARVRSSARAAMTATLLLVGACHTDTRASFGEGVDPAAAVRLSQVLADESTDRSVETVVAGRVGEVCRSAGCWFVLLDGEGREGVEILVDLRPAASFTVPTGIQGREAIVRGRLVGERPDLQINAVGLLVE